MEVQVKLYSSRLVQAVVRAGGIYFMDAVLMDGGNAGNRESNGGDSINYGAGAGGGGGVATAGHFPGYGGKGETGTYI